MAFTYRELIKEPLMAEELEKIAALGATTIKELLNPGSITFKKMGLDMKALDDEQAALLINENPRIMRRPLLSDGKKLIIGFVPEDYAALAGI